ncbi:phospholipase A [soil metagenome]
MHTFSTGFSTLLITAAAHAATSAQDCTTLTDDAQRLACYDTALRKPAELVAPAAAAPSLTVPQAEADTIRQRHLGSTIDERWELTQDTALGAFLPRPYKPLYIMPAVTTNRVNRQPQSPTPDHSPVSPLNLDKYEAKFQISLKSKLLAGIFGGHGNLWMGYTQSSHWQIYNNTLSRPFRETNYEPELMLVFATPYEFLGIKGRMTSLSLNHQSNGQQLPLSRSWNRVIGELAFESGDWTLSLRPWWRLKETTHQDDNPGIEDYIGRGEALLTRKWGGHVFTLQGRHSLKRGDRSRGSLQIDWAFPMFSSLHGYAQVFTGYGESLLDYNFKQTRIGVGVSLVEWR